MALPADVSTITLTFGPYLDAAGKPTCAGLSATITPDRRVTHAGDGTVILPVPLTVTLDANAAGSIVLPFTDLAVLSSPFSYQIAWRYTGGPTPPSKAITLPHALGPTVDYDLLIDAGPLPVGTTTVLITPTGPAGTVGAALVATDPTTTNARAATDASVHDLVVGPSTTADALRAAYVPKWKANTAYVAATDFVLNPSGQVVQPIADFTSGTTYNPANWTVVAGLASTLIDNGDGTGTIVLGSTVQTTNTDTTALHTTANLSDIANAVTARSNLGLGSAATHPASDFDTSGAASSAQAYAIQRANHTGTQSADTLTDGTTIKAFLATERTKLTAVALNNYTATTDPTVSSDNTGGYGVGSVWVNITSKVAFVCLSAATGAAVWQRQTADVQVFTASGTWTKPSWAATTRLTLIGAGGGGGSGAVTTSGTSASGGGGGGGGAFAVREVPTSALGASETVTIGAPGAGGAAQATSSTAGNAGGTAAASTFGSHLRVGGSTYGAGGGGQIGGNSTAGSAGSSMIAGATGGAGIGSAAGGGGAQSAGAASGGGAGGGISSTPAQFAGGAGNTSGAGGVGAGTAGTAGGGAGGSATSLTAGEPIGGSSGGGGGSNISGNGGAGGNGGNYGGGGGGGGAALNGSTSGAGGNGGPGICLAISL